MRHKIITALFLLLVFFVISGDLHASYFEEGCRYFSAKKYEKAREIFTKCTEANPDDGNSYYFLGEIEKNENNFDKALEYYKIAVNKIMIGKYKRLAYWDMILIEEQKGKYNEMVTICIEFWNKMGDSGAKKKVDSLINKFLWTDNDDAKLLYNEGLNYLKKNMIEQAKNSFSDALRKDSNFLAPKFEIGLILYNDNNSNAISYFTDIIDKIPFYGAVHLLLGDINYNKQSYRNSKEYFSKAMEYGFLDNKMKYSLHLKIGNSCYETGDYDRAIEEFTAASDLEKKEIDPLLLLSAVYIKKNDHEKAVIPLLKARDMDPKNPDITFQIGSLYYKMNDQKYVQYFNSLITKYSAGKELLPQKYHKVLVILIKNYYENKKYDDASKLSDIIPESVKNPDISLMSARSHYYAGKYEKSIESFSKLSLSNDDKFLISISYAKTGMPDKSKEILLNLFDYPGFPERAKSEPSIKKIAAEIENEKIRKEEEKRKASMIQQEIKINNEIHQDKALPEENKN